MAYSVLMAKGMITRYCATTLRPGDFGWSEAGTAPLTVLHARSPILQLLCIHYIYLYLAFGIRAERLQSATRRQLRETGPAWSGGLSRASAWIESALGCLCHHSGLLRARTPAKRGSGGYRLCVSATQRGMKKILPIAILSSLDGLQPIQSRYKRRGY